MVSAALLLVLLTIATVTDVRWRCVYNWTTYPGIVAALGLSAAASVLSSQAAALVPFRDSVLGFAACGAVMLVCYVFFAGGVGGGDVKLIAMMGAFLGLAAGLEAMLWTFVLGACLALITLVWRHGCWQLLRQGARFAYYRLRLGRSFQLSPSERRPLEADLYLSPSALAATLIVLWPY